MVSGGQGSEVHRSMWLTINHGLKSEGVVVEVRVSTNTGEPVRLKLSDRPSVQGKTGTYSLKEKRSVKLNSIQFRNDGFNPEYIERLVKRWKYNKTYSLKYEISQYLVFRSDKTVFVRIEKGKAWLQWGFPFDNKTFSCRITGEITATRTISEQPVISQSENVLTRFRS